MKNMTNVNQPLFVFFISILLGLNVAFCNAAQETTNAPPSKTAEEGKKQQSWFSWWGPAKPDTNAPLVSLKTEPAKQTNEQAISTQPVPAQSSAATTPAAKPTKPEAKTKDTEKTGQGWFLWLRRSVKTTPAEKPPKSEAYAKDSDKTDGSWFSWWGRAKASEKPKDMSPAKEKEAASKTAGSASHWWQFGRSSHAASNGLSEKAGSVAAAPVEKAQALEQPTAKKLPPWRLSAGIMQRRIGKTSMFATDSFSRHEPIANQSANGQQRFNHVGSANNFADRVYDNGYVAIDEWTVLDGGTTFWGFEHAGQVHNGYIEFNALTSVEKTFQRNITISDSSWEKSSDSEWSGLASVDWMFYRNQGLMLGLGLSASRASFSGAGADSTFSDSQEWRTYQTTMSDRYSLAGTGLTPGAQPASWSPGNSGPVIDNIPTHRNTTRQQTASGSYDAFNAISQKMSMDLYTFSCGLSLGFEWWRLLAAGMAGPTMNYIDAEGTYEETLYASANRTEALAQKTWQASHAESEFTAGFYLQAGLFIDVVAGLQLGIFGRYDWLEDFLGATGPSQYKVNLSGGSYGASIGMNF